MLFTGDTQLPISTLCERPFSLVLPWSSLCDISALPRITKHYQLHDQEEGDSPLVRQNFRVSSASSIAKFLQDRVPGQTSQLGDQRGPRTLGPHLTNRAVRMKNPGAKANTICLIPAFDQFLRHGACLAIHNGVHRYKQGFLSWFPSLD